MKKYAIYLSCGAEVAAVCLPLPFFIASITYVLICTFLLRYQSAVVPGLTLKASAGMVCNGINFA